MGDYFPHHNIVSVTNVAVEYPHPPPPPLYSLIKTYLVFSPSHHPVLQYVPHIYKLLGNVVQMKWTHDIMAGSVTPVNILHSCIDPQTLEFAINAGQSVKLSENRKYAKTWNLNSLGFVA